MELKADFQENGYIVYFFKGNCQVSNNIVCVDAQRKSWIKFIISNICKIPHEKNRFFGNVLIWRIMLNAKNLW